MRPDLDLNVTGVSWSSLDESAQAALRPLIESGVLVTYIDETSGTVQLTFAGGSVPCESPRLCDFIRVNAAFLAWRRRLHARASLWRLGGQPAELLLPEEETRVALRWKSERQPELSAVEMSLIDESLKSQQAFSSITKTRAMPAAAAAAAPAGGEKTADKMMPGTAAAAPPQPSPASSRRRRCSGRRLQAPGTSTIQQT